MAIIKAKYTEEYLNRRRSFGVYIFSIIGGGAAGFLTDSLSRGIFNYQTITTVVISFIAMGISLLEIGKLIFRGETIKDSGLIALVLKTDDGISLQNKNPSNFLVDSSIFTKKLGVGAGSGNNTLDVNGGRKRVFETCGLCLINFMIWSYPNLWAPLEVRNYNGMKIHNYKLDVPKVLITTASIASELKSFSSIFERTETILGVSAERTFAVPQETSVKVEYSSDFFLKVSLYNRDYNLSLTFQIPTIQTGLNRNYEEYVTRHADLRNISKQEYNKMFLSFGVEVTLEASFPWFRSMVTNTTNIRNWIEDFKSRYFEYMGVEE